jgi:uncharacterized protein (TIGR02246 family)
VLAAEGGNKMRKAIVIAGGLSALLCLSGCGEMAGSAQKRGASATADASATVGKNQADFLAALRAKDFARVKAHYAPDAVMIQPGEPVFKGIAAISANYDQFARDAGASVEGINNSIVVSSAGDLAFAEGTYDAGFTNPKTKAISHSKGYYVLIYRKQPDGSWKIVRDISSTIPN